MSYGEIDSIHIGDVTQPAHDYLCSTCAEMFTVHYSRDNKPIAVTCPICASGLTGKIFCAPAVKVRWKDARSASDSSQMKPKFKSAATNRAISRRQQ